MLVYFVEMVRVLECLVSRRLANLCHSSYGIWTDHIVVFYTLYITIWGSD